MGNHFEVQKFSALSLLVTLDVCDYICYIYVVYRVICSLYSLYICTNYIFIAVKVLVELDSCALSLNFFVVFALYSFTTLFAAIAKFQLNDLAFGVVWR